MALSLANIRTRVKTHIRAEMATPAVNDLNNASIDGWANEHCTDVIRILKDPVHFSSLIVPDTSITFSSGYASLPTGYELALAVKVATTTPTVTKRNCELLFDPQEFAKRDSSNFILTPDNDHPVVLIANARAYIKPTALTTGYLDYVKKHPTITTSQDTLFDSMGDKVLIDLILSSYYGFLEEYELQANHQKLAGVQ